MRTLAPLVVLWLGLLVSCSGEEPGSSAAASGSALAGTGENAKNQPPSVPEGDPATLPKVHADRDAISDMLRERFGDAVARNVRVEVDQQAGATRVGLAGEVPSEEIRQALMRELEARVEGLTIADFRLELAGPVPLLFGFDARLDMSLPAAFAPDLSLAVTPEGEIYEMATGRRLNRIALPNSELRCMAFSPDGTVLATGHRRGEIVLWTMPLGRDPRAIAPPAPANAPNSQVVSALAFTPDGRQLVSISGQHGDIRLWDLSRPMAKTIGSHLPHDSSRQLMEAYCIAVSPDGASVATANFDEDFVSVWDIASRSRTLQLAAEPIHPEAMAWSHDGKMLAAARTTGEKRGAAVYDLTNRTPRVLALEQDELVAALAFSPDDRTLAVRYHNDGIRLWDVGSATEALALPHEKVGAGKAVAFSPDGLALAADCVTISPPAIRMWDISGRPGAPHATAGLPRAYLDIVAQDDLLCAEIQNAIVRTFDRRNTRDIRVELLPDGSIRLTGKVSAAAVKASAQRIAEVHRAGELPGTEKLRTVVNELEVTGELLE